MTASALVDRFAVSSRGSGLVGLVVVVALMVAVTATAGTAAAQRVFADWLAAVLPAAGFAVAGASLGHLVRCHPLLSRAPDSILGLAADIDDGVRVTKGAGRAVVPSSERVAGVYGAGIVSPFVLAAAVVAFEGEDRAILACLFLLVAICAATAAGWAVLPTLRGAPVRAPDTARRPVGQVRVAGTVFGAGASTDALVVSTTALRVAATGTGVAALAAGVLPDAAVAWLGARPAIAAALAIAVAVVAAPGAEAGCFAAATLAAFGPAAVVGFAATAAVCDIRFLRMLQMLVGRGSAWRSAVAAVPILFAGAVWSGVMLR